MKVFLKHGCFFGCCGLLPFLALKIGCKTWWKSCPGYTGKAVYAATEDVALVSASVHPASLSNVSCNYMVALGLCHLFHQICDLEKVDKWLT